MIECSTGKVSIVGKSVEEQMNKKPQSEATFARGKVQAVPHTINSREEECTKKEIWVTFNANGSIFSTSNEQPLTNYDQWDNQWIKMVSE